MQLENIAINWDESLHNSRDRKKNGIIAIESKEQYDYQNNHKTDKVKGISVTVVDLFNKFEKTVVKVSGITKPLDIKDNSKYMHVYFSNLQGKVYQINNSINFSITADNVEFLNSSNEG